MVTHENSVGDIFKVDWDMQKKEIRNMYPIPAIIAKLVILDYVEA